MEHKYKEKYKTIDLNEEVSNGKYLGIDCPNCDTPSPSANINIQDKIAKCDQCDSVFSFEAMLPKLKPQVVEETMRPQGLDVLHLKDEVEFSIRQPYSGVHVMIAFFIPIFLFLSTALYIKRPDDFMLYASIMMGLMLGNSLYRLYRSRYEKVFITIDKTHVNVMWRPNNMIMDRSFPIQEIDQVYLKSYNGVGLYLVRNTADGQKHERILGSLTDLNKAKFLEQEIEKHLGIENRKVIGELK